MYGSGAGPGERACGGDGSSGGCGWGCGWGGGGGSRAGAEGHGGWGGGGEEGDGGHSAIQHVLRGGMGVARQRCGCGPQAVLLLLLLVVGVLGSVG